MERQVQLQWYVKYGFELFTGQKQCSWTVTANDGQNIRIQVQDMKLDSYRMKCVSSYLLITDAYGKHEYKLCGTAKGTDFCLLAQI